jgi:hypothetical protein
LRAFVLVRSHKQDTTVIRFPGWNPGPGTLASPGCACRGDQSDQRPTIFPNAATTTALIDRLVHHAEILTIEGDSYRRRVAENRRKPPKPPSET